MSLFITAIIPYLLYGAIGGNVVGLLYKGKKGLGVVVDTLVGAIGGFAIGFLLNTAGEFIPPLAYFTSVVLPNDGGFTNGLGILMSFIISIAPGALAVYIIDTMRKF